MMKKMYFLFVTSLCSTLLTAQTKVGSGLVQLNIGDKYQPAEVEFADGSVKQGFINGFLENNFIEFGSSTSFDNFESQLNLDDKKFYFKTEENGKAIVLQQKDLQQVTVMENGGEKSFRLLNIKTVGKNKQIVDLNRKVWLPLLEERDEFSLYGFNLFINNRFVNTYVYISGDNINAYKPTDKTFPSTDTMKESYTIMLKHVFNQCEAVNPNIAEFMNVEKWKQEKKKLDVRLKELKKDKNIPEANKEDAILRLNQEYFTEPYIAIISQYKLSCKI
ncbi:MAG TPA: hypothetical protein VGB44_12730 [Flavobacterium sp.]|jgi:hypothetical protein